MLELNLKIEAVGFKLLDSFPMFPLLDYFPVATVPLKAGVLAVVEILRH